ncbi:flagellar basal body P-ring formation chaperone FlgA [Legionella worsleiensis]|uniref:Flagellar basal body P-ring biosynthesis protein FlgA n=1 Tax=Legionella worsleiensis TaxID=45076 RepID=A0A0W1A5Y6_9GAMM|nr:flagellar basal body P-ring formation chaperone FlgA [Legionella worsleiensis]KTD76769.1 flagellar basal body P-ring biosynthesis protein FlgA [Legionella worsleiensis]STY30587.1 flagellar basal body P-ring biosynthesis protein FlgA [Legionella worsleiensis]
MKFVIKLMICSVFYVPAYAKAVMFFQKHITPNARILGDVVSITNDENKLMQIPLDSHPNPGETINKKQIIEWITQKKGAIDIKWQGKSTTLVQQKIQTTGDELRHKAQTELEHRLKNKYDSITLIPKGQVKDSEFPLAEFHTELPESDLPAQQICVMLIHGKRSVPVWFKVSAFQNVLVAKNSMKSRTRLHQSDFILEKRNIAGLKNKPLTQLPKDFWLKNSIKTHQILKISDVAPVPQIIRGQRVKITVFNKGIFLRSEAIAQHDGYTGQFVRMKNPLSDKYFVAQVIAPHQAEISS